VGRGRPPDSCAPSRSEYRSMSRRRERGPQGGVSTRETTRRAGATGVGDLAAARGSPVFYGRRDRHPEARPRPDARRMPGRPLSHGTARVGTRRRDRGAAASRAAVKRGFRVGAGRSAVGEQVARTFGEHGLAPDLPATGERSDLRGGSRRGRGRTVSSTASTRTRSQKGRTQKPGSCPPRIAPEKLVGQRQMTPRGPPHPPAAIRRATSASRRRASITPGQS